jgi:hypothetical protein
VLVLGLSWAYLSYGTHSGTHHLVVGLDALVIGVLASVTIDFAAEHTRRPVPIGIAAGAFAVAVAGASVLWAVLGALIVGAVALHGAGELAPGVLAVRVSGDRRRVPAADADRDDPQSWPVGAGLPCQPDRSTDGCRLLAAMILAFGPRRVPDVPLKTWPPYSR